MPQFNIPSPPNADYLKIDRFGGLNLDPDLTQLEPWQTPDCLNVAIDDEGTIDKRTGYEKAFTTTLAGKVNGMFRYKDKMIIAAGTQLYEWDFTNEPTSIYTSVTDTKMRAFEFEDNLYMINGNEYLVYDGVFVQEVQPYIPTIRVSTPPNGGGQAYEDFNLLGSGFKQLFSPDGTSTVFQLALDDLDATEVSIKHNGATLTENTHFTIDRTNGTVDFSAGSTPYGAPAEGTNTLEITAYKTISGFKEKITKCNIWNVYGGKNDTHVQLSGHPDYPNIIRRSGVHNASYFPENEYDRIGTPNDKIMNMKIQYDSCVIFKNYSTWMMAFELNGGDPIYPVKPINSAEGCMSTDSVQIVQNNPVFLNGKGVQMLVSSQVRDERNIVCISNEINDLLLQENLEEAISAEFENKYILIFPTTGKVYVYYYNTKDWVIWDNIYATDSLVVGERFYFGTSNGVVYKFKKRTDSYPYNDDGEAINAYWTTKLFELQSPAHYKMTQKFFLAIRSNYRSSIDVYFMTDRKYWQFLVKCISYIFSYRELSYDPWVYTTTLLPNTQAKKFKNKKIIYLQFKFENNELNESMGILSATVKYITQREVK